MKRQRQCVVLLGRGVVRVHEPCEAGQFQRMAGNGDDDDDDDDDHDHDDVDADDDDHMILILIIMIMMMLFVALAPAMVARMKLPIADS